MRGYLGGVEVGDDFVGVDVDVADTNLKSHIIGQWSVGVVVW